MINRLNFDDDGALLCPYCSGNRIHHWLVEMVDREIDGDTAKKIDLNFGAHAPHASKRFEPTQYDDKNEYLGNPSPREHGTKIVFVCDDCGKWPHLHIAEDEGRTTVKWAPTIKDLQDQDEAEDN